MFLKRFVYVNWGNIPTLEFEFGPVNLFSGGNGSGKTTAADAIQTVMTAAHENLFHFNPGQDETTQRGRGGKRVRTLESYVLGCDDGSYARLDPTDGYLAAVFHPTPGEAGDPFTAIIAVRAWLDRAGTHAVARQENAQFFVLPGVELNQAHFVREAAGEKYTVASTEIYKLLITEFGKKSVEKYETKKAYLRRLYGVLRNRADAVSEPEAVAAARAFSRFMAYKPVKGINKFVADEILEQKDLGEAIRSVSSQLKTIHRMEADAGKLVDSIGILEQANLHAQTYIERWIELNVLDYTLAQAEYQARQQAYNKQKQQQSDQRQSLKEKQQEILDNSAQSEVIYDQLVNLEAKRQGVDALRHKDELEKKRQRLDDLLVAKAKQVLEQDQTLASNQKITQNIKEQLQLPALNGALPDITGLHTNALAVSLIKSEKKALTDVHSLVQRSFASELEKIEEQMPQVRELQRLHNQWYSYWHGEDKGQDITPRETLSHFTQSCRTKYQGLSEKRSQKRQEIDRLSSNQVTFPSYVERAIKAIQTQCPKADPRVLCDHVEVKDESWQSAIEGYLGGTRFSILVEPAYEAEAIRIVRSLAGRDNRARVIQGSKAQDDANRLSLESDSIIQVMSFSHEVARSFITASYGSVKRVESVEKLRYSRRGVTVEGMGSGNYSMFRCDLPDSSLVFGAAARERALTAKLAELEQIEIEWNQAKELHQQSQQLLQWVDQLQPSSYADSIYSVIDVYREVEKIEGQLGHLDLTAHEDLEQQLADLKQERDRLTSSGELLNQEVGKLQEQLAKIEKELARLSDQQEENRERVDQREEALNAIPPVWPDFNVAQRLDSADQESKDLDISSTTLFRAEMEKELHSAERKVSDAIQAHNQNCRPSDAIEYLFFSGDYDAGLFKAICSLQREVDRVYNILKNNILVEKHQQLGELRESFNNAFVSHLCHAIYQALNEGKQQIEALNRELQHHHFGADRETFRFSSEWIPEYRDYARFFEEVVKNPVLGEEVTLFDADLSARANRVLQDLLSKLLDEDEQRAIRDLERIADYRNYRRYEIYKDVEGKEPIPLSEYGTGSGGQLETPAYIIRSAAITSAFRFVEGKSHLRMVLVDEAFSKMDETRSREVINYLTQSLGLQLIFIMPTSKCGPFMDLISNEFVFAKIPSDKARGELNTRVLVDRKKCDREKIQSLWANHRRTVREQAELDFMSEFSEAG